VIPRVFLLAFAFVACVPTGSAPPYDAGPPPVASNYQPSVNVMTAPFEDTFDRPDAEGAVPASGDASAMLGDAAPSSTRPGKKEKDGGPPTTLLDGATEAAAEAEPGADASMSLGADAEAERHPSNLGPNWTQVRTNAWRVENGRLCGEGAKNHGVWLNKTLPINARIEYDAIALTEQGDLKSEVWGDGHTYAVSTSYTGASSYLVILGGWHNSLHVLARQNEHGNDRKEVKVDKESDDPRQRAIVRGQLYQVKVERTDGKTIKVWVNGVEYFSWSDPAPLEGHGHDHFGFNEWEAKVCFDNVKVTPL
jgi:hypothetical protein